MGLQRRGLSLGLLFPPVAFGGVTEGKAGTGNKFAPWHAADLPKVLQKH